MESLADALGLNDPYRRTELDPRLENVIDPRDFAQAILESREFRQYILSGLTLGSIPPAIVVRIMDLAGWVKPPDRVEHTGKDGRPIESITEVRRVVIRVQQPIDSEEDVVPYKTH